MSVLIGLRTVIYHVPELGRAKEWYRTVLGIEPYFDEPFYVGFNVGGYELGLDPDGSHPPGAAGSTAYWGVANAEEALAAMLQGGAVLGQPVTEVGGGIRVATVLDPWGNEIGIIENPHFTGGS